jgi:AraC-like DNA-binding protein
MAAPWLSARVPRVVRVCPVLLQVVRRAGLPGVPDKRPVMAEVFETMDVGVVEHVLSDGYAKMQPTRDLINGDPAHESVTAVAYRWGFPSASRFASRCRHAYGVSPSHTLRH